MNIIKKSNGVTVCDVSGCLNGVDPETSQIAYIRVDGAEVEVVLCDKHALKPKETQL